MQRRPWPLVILAIIQFFTPLMSLIVSSRLNSVTVSQMATIAWHTSNWFERFQFYAAPLLVGILILHARVWGFFLVVSYGVFISVINFLEWRHAQHPISIAILVIVNLLAIALVAYLCLPKVRAIFFNSRLRWWETKPRYLVNLTGEAQVTSEIAENSPMPCMIQDLSLGGGGLSAEKEFPIGEKAEVRFQFNDESFTLKGLIVYGLQLPNSYRFGVEWYFETYQNKLKYKELISYFKRQRYAQTRKPPEWRTDLKSWLERAKRDPRAWLPELETGRPAKAEVRVSDAPDSGTG